MTTARSLSESVPLEERRYIVQDRDGEYLCQIIHGNTATLKWHFKWSKHRYKAMEFHYDQLCRRGPEALSAKEQDKSLLMNLTVGYAGVKMVRVR